MISLLKHETGNEESWLAHYSWLRRYCLLLRSWPRRSSRRKSRRIGYLSSGDAASESARAEAIRLALRELGYIEGQNIASEYRYAEGKADRHLSWRPIWCVSRLISSWQQEGPGDPGRQERDQDDSHRYGRRWARSCRSGSSRKPCPSRRQHHGHYKPHQRIGGKRLELLKEAVPKIARAAVLYDPAFQASAGEVKEVLPVVARALGLTIQPWGVRDADGFERVFAALNKQRPDGLYVPGGPAMRANGKRSSGFAIKSRLPSVYDNKEAVEGGGLMYYGADLENSYRRVATYVDKILKGAKPADLPVEQPTKFELVINQKTAKQIGVTIPQSMLYRADKVIKVTCAAVPGLN